MKCTSVRARPEAREEDGRKVVMLSVGNFRPVGCYDEQVWVEMPPGMARSVAADLIDAANQIERESNKSS